ncbi:hypothetical protein D3C76_870140 [compost metagenome]
MGDHPIFAPDANKADAQPQYRRCAAAFEENARHRQQANRPRQADSFALRPEGQSIQEEVCDRSEQVAERKSCLRYEGLPASA